MSQSARLIGCVRALLFAALVVAIGGCGRSDLDQGYAYDAAGLDVVLPTCNAATCATGCCDSNNACQPGTSSAACGANGLACAACQAGSTCAASTQTCTNVPPPPPTCDANNCTTGCCDATGTCQPGNQATVCGTAGEACANCPSEGFQQCDPSLQLCDTPQATCDPTSCASGCCQPDGMGGFLCADGTEDSACGAGGQACQSCSSVGAVCDPSGHQCVATPCGSQNCNGCCLGAQCITGTIQNACGTGGEECQNCGPSGMCNGGACTGSQCSPANCGGCCDQNGLCQGGGDQFACGSGGNQCTPCQPNAFCDSGVCQNSNACGPQNCTGCCDSNGACQVVETSSVCGTQGNTCFACPPGLGCSNGTCIPQGNCGPENCPGCCDFTGTCQPGASQTACGTFGNFCSACGPGTTCEAGSCQMGTTCGPQNCAGCCDLNGFCQAGSSGTQCGNSGSSCESCETNFTCQAVTTGGGLCEQVVTSCGPSNCPNGCCNANQCTTGDSAAGCGTGGGACKVCPTTDLCESGTCVTQVCGPATCPNGCCDGNGVCQGGNTSADCGIGGGSCQICTSGLTCQIFPGPNGPDASCSPPICGPSNCAGCCDNNGVCQTGTATADCGNAGGFCETCPPSFTCSKGICEMPVTNCGPANCPTGCCLGNQCTTGDTAAACGTGGQACSVCPANDVCGNNFGQLVCAPQPCTFQNCPNGCCDINNVCQTGTTSSDCGSFGNFCNQCTFGLTCQQGFCQEPACGPNNCGGCCNANAFCQAGNTTTSCGTGGANCEACPTNFTCSASTGLCEQTVTNCGPATCPSGCCINNECVTGTNTLACGTGGNACADCAADDTCVNGACVVPACGPGTCPFGCCQGNTCVSGETISSCGFGGGACTTCPANNTCEFGFCQGPDASACGPSNCTGCCDLNAVCQAGTTTSVCGGGGVSCTVCPSSSTCTAQVCKASTACSATNCAGCCDSSGECEAGFIDSACGGGGAACANCTTQNSTCDSDVAPRACSNVQTACPGTFGSCPSTVITPTLTQMNVCPNSDLLNAQEACDQGSDGATSTACQQFFLFEKTSNPACYACLTPFNVDFNSDPTGVFACMSSFVNQSCNQQTGCLSDCIHTACSGCTASGLADCETNATNTSCSDFLNNEQCIINAFEDGTGTVCEPFFNGNGFGDWLFGVGQFYCAQ